MQTSEVPLSYYDAALFIVQRDGIQGLFWNGLLTKIVSNGIQSIMFSVLWKMFMDRQAAKAKEQALANAKRAK